MDNPHDPNAPEEPIMAHAVPEYARRPPPPRPRGGLGRWIVVIFMLMVAAVGAFVMLAFASAVVMAVGGVPAGLEERHHSLDEAAPNKVAIIRVEGAIINPDGFVKKQIDRVREDKDVKAVVLRVNSPGGTVTASDYLYHHLNELKDDRDIPIVVSMGGIAASGGYYVAMAVGDEKDSIFAEPTTWTGSIGVIIPHYNFQGLMEHWDIQDDSIASHDLKDMGSPFKEMTPEERAIFQGLVDNSFDRFKEVVKSGRPKFREDPEALDKVATGQIFTTDGAIEHGLVDKEGFVEAAIDRAIELAGLNRKQVNVVEYKEQRGLFDIGLSAQARGAPIDLKTFVELTSPRAYYLCTWAPPLEQ